MNHQRSIVVDGVAIPESLIAQEAQHHPAANSADARAAAGRALAVRTLLLDRARDLELQPAPERDAQGREETDEEALIRQLLAREVEAEPASLEACRKFHEDHPDWFMTPALYSASHILCAPEDDSRHGWDVAEAQAREVIVRLKKGVNFESLARELSACSSAAAGGQLGQMQSGDLVSEVEAALQEMSAGQWSHAPVLSRFGWHVLRLDQWAAGRALPFEHVEDDIRLYLDSRAWVAAASRYGRELAAKARRSGVVLSLTVDGETEAPTLTLGTFLGAGHDDWAALENWLMGADAELAARVSQSAAEQGRAVAEFVQAEVLDFAQGSGDEGWTSLISAAQNSADPMLESIRFILRTRLAPARTARTIIRAR